MLALLLPLLGPIIDKLTGLIPDPEARAKAQAEATAQVVAAVQAADQAQMQVNADEAKSNSVFVAGWRPAIGWVCACALGFQYLARPIVSGALAAAGHADVVLPGLDDNLWQLMTAMLGMGALRSFDKVKGVATTSLPLSK